MDSFLCKSRCRRFESCRGTTLTSANAGLRTGLPIPYPFAHLRTAADSLAENRTQIVGLSVDLAANTPTVVATEVVIQPCRNLIHDPRPRFVLNLPAKTIGKRTDKIVCSTRSGEPPPWRSRSAS